MELGTRILELVTPPLTGPDVEAWQRIIATHPVTGVTRLGVGGIFDDATDTITRIWQSEHGLVSDGIVGPVALTVARHVTQDEEVPRPLPPAQDVEVALARRRAKADAEVRKP